jgi:DNA-damage-inducible protein D
MAKEIIKTTLTVFEQIKLTDNNGNEFWSARDLSKVLEYSEYRHFIPVVDRAKEACENSGQLISHHFEDILEMIRIGKTAKREVESVKLSRYACYLIVQNADPSKKVVALGQTYFAVQTRIQEIQQMEEYSSLSS